MLTPLILQVAVGIIGNVNTQSTMLLSLTLNSPDFSSSSNNAGGRKHRWQCGPTCAKFRGKRVGCKALPSVGCKTKPRPVPLPPPLPAPSSPTAPLSHCITVPVPTTLLRQGQNTVALCTTPPGCPPLTRVMLLMHPAQKL